MKNKYTYPIVISLIVVSFIAYGRILGNGFVNLDDAIYITENSHIQKGFNAESIKWAFTAVVGGNWHPLTLLSHTLDWSLFGANAFGHHFVNLLLHICSVLLLFFFLNRTTKNLWQSAFAAALFALHPLRVESLAWASERKDVLSMFFGLASVYAYARYAEDSRLSRYFLCLILFALSLTAKPMLVTLPFVLLLLDYWPLGRWQKDSIPVNVPVPVVKKASGKKNKQHKADSVKENSKPAPQEKLSPLFGSLLLEKAPFIFLTIVSGIVTLWAQHKGGAVVSMEGLHFPDRVANAVISYVSYLGKLFWPVDLVVFYPFEYTFPLWHFLIFCFILIVITSAVIYTVKKLPFLFTGWFWYLGTLVPVIGLVQVGEQSMADRYTYLPSIGIAIMLAWGIPLFFRSADMRKKILFPAGAAVLIIITALTWYQCGYWKSDFKLFNHALQLTKNNYFVHNVLGLSLLNKDKMEEAIEHFNEVIRLRPNYILPYCSRGKAYAKLGQYQRAVEDYNEAIRREPDYAEAYNYRGIAYGKLGQQQHAIEDYSRAIVLKPDYSDAYNNRGYAYAMSGQYQRAIEDYNETIRLQPDALAYINRGAAYLSRGNSELGCRDAQMACVLGSCELLEGAKGRGFCR